MGTRSLYLFLTTVVTGVLGYAYWVIAARQFSPATVGQTAALVGIVLLITGFGTFGMGLGAAYVYDGASRDWNRVVNGVLLTTAVVSAGAAITITASSWMFNLELVPSVDRLLFLLVFTLTAASWSTTYVGDQIFVIENAAHIALIRNALSSALRLGLLFMATEGEGDDVVLELIAGWGIGNIASYVLALLLFMKVYRTPMQLDLSVDLSKIKNIVSVSLLNHITLALYAMPLQLMPFLVSKSLSMEDAAYFHVAAMMSSMLTTIPFSVARSMFSEFASKGTVSLSVMKRLIAFSLLFSSPFIVVTIMINRPILSIVGQSYAEFAGPLLIFMVLAVVPESVYQVYSAFARVRREFGRVLILSVISAFGILAGSWCLMSLLGLVGAGVAVVGTYSVVAAGCLLSIRPRQDQGWSTRVSRGPSVPVGRD